MIPELRQSSLIEHEIRVLWLGATREYAFLPFGLGIDGSKPKMRARMHVIAETKELIGIKQEI